MAFMDFVHKLMYMLFFMHHVVSKLQQVISEIGWSLFKVPLSKNTSIINALMSFPSSAFEFKTEVQNRIERSFLYEAIEIFYLSLFFFFNFFSNKATVMVKKGHFKNIL